MQIQLANYPRFIEPTIEVLELTTGADAATQKWTPLQRIAPQQVLAELVTVPAGGIHFFGTSQTLADVQFVLCYDCGGKLVGVLIRGQEGWEFMDTPAEVLGQHVSYPSVRLVFKTERVREAFLLYIQQVMEGKRVNPSMAVVLDQLQEAPISIAVSRQDTGG